MVLAGLEIDQRAERTVNGFVYARDHDTTLDDLDQRSFVDSVRSADVPPTVRTRSLHQTSFTL